VRGNSKAGCSQRTVMRRKWLQSNRKERNGCETYGPSDDMGRLTSVERARFAPLGSCETDLYLAERVQFVSCQPQSREDAGMD